MWLEHRELKARWERNEVEEVGRSFRGLYVELYRPW